MAFLRFLFNFLISFLLLASFFFTIFFTIFLDYFKIVLSLQRGHVGLSEKTTYFYKQCVWNAWPVNSFLVQLR